MKYYIVAYFHIHPLLHRTPFFCLPLLCDFGLFIPIKYSIHFQCSFFAVWLCVSLDELEIYCFTKSIPITLKNEIKITRMLEVYFQCRSTSILYSWSFFFLSFFLSSPCLVYVFVVAFMLSLRPVSHLYEILLK